MKEDIQLTKINKTYREMWEKITVLLNQCIDEHGEMLTANVARNLAIEMGGRCIFASTVVAQEDPKEMLEYFIFSVHERSVQLFEDAVERGLIKEGDEE